MEPKSLGIYDNYRVKKQLIHSSTSIASNMILVDEILRADLSALRSGGQLSLSLSLTTSDVTCWSSDT